MGRPSFSHVQSIVGLVAGLTSIVGAAYSGLLYFRPAPPPGELTTVVREARSDKPVRGATVEILTPDEVLVTTMTPAEDGLARQALKEGPYRVRVIHPQFTAETRQVHVSARQTAVVRFQLTPRAEVSAAPSQRRARAPGLDDAARTVDAGVGAAVRLFRHFGL